MPSPVVRTAMMNVGLLNDSDKRALVTLVLKEGKRMPSSPLKEVLKKLSLLNQASQLTDAAIAAVIELRGRGAI